MKNLLLISFLMVSLGLSAQEDDKYMRTMKSVVSKLDTAETQSTIQKAANKMERIATAEKSKWLPNYWTAFSNMALIRFTQDKDQGKALLKKADRFITIADSLNPNNSEIHVLRGWWYQTQMQFGGNPMEYGPLSSSTFDKAIELDDGNPRAHSFKAMGVYFTPPAFGGGKDKAKPMFEKSLEKYKTFKPKSEIHPDWGQEFTEMMYEKCTESEK